VTTRQMLFGSSFYRAEVILSRTTAD
jgi:hypothetical protein